MIYIGIVAAIFLAEYIIKNRVEKRLEKDVKKEVAGGRVLLQKYHNKGAFLNMGEKSQPAVAALSVILTACILVMFLLTLGQKGNGLMKAGLSVLLGGAFSNTYDRIRRKYVVDYFSFGVTWKPLQNIVFNLADFCILFGALGVVLGKR